MILVVIAVALVVYAALFAFSVTMLHYIGAAWLIIVLAWKLGRILLASTMTSRQVAKNVGGEDSRSTHPVQKICDELTSELGMEKVPILYAREGKFSEKTNACAVDLRGPGVITVNAGVLALPPLEQRALLAHELGHVAHGHSYRALVRGAVTAVIIFAVGMHYAGTFQPLSWDAAAKVAGALLLARFLLGLTSSYLSRRNERAADKFAAEKVGAAPVELLFTRLGVDHTGIDLPGTLEDVLRTHPSPQNRIRRVQRMIR